MRVLCKRERTIADRRGETDIHELARHSLIRADIHRGISFESDRKVDSKIRRICDNIRVERSFARSFHSTR